MRFQAAALFDPRELNRAFGMSFRCTAPPTSLDQLPPSCPLKPGYPRASIALLIVKTSLKYSPIYSLAGAVCLFDTTTTSAHPEAFSEAGALNLEMLRTRGITHILSVMVPDPARSERQKGDGFRRMNIPVQDWPDEVYAQFTRGSKSAPSHLFGE